MSSHEMPIPAPVETDVSENATAPAQEEVGDDKEKHKSFMEKLKTEIDMDEFKRKAITAVMQCTSGKNKLDYYLADVAVSYWIENLDKSPEEMESMLLGLDLPEQPTSDEGFIGVEGEVQECVPLDADGNSDDVTLLPVVDEDVALDIEEISVVETVKTQSEDIIV